MTKGRLFFIDSVCNFRELPNKYHRFHLLKPSIWPFFAALGVLLLVYGLIFWFYTGRLFTVFFGLFELIVTQIFWWQEVSYESGEQTEEISQGLKIGMALFIVSEVMFFFSFFWAFFHVSLVPSFEIGSLWPPIGLASIIINPWEVPLLNTFLLLASGVTVTGAHHAFLQYFKLEKFCTVWSVEELQDFVLVEENYLYFKDLIISILLLKKKATSRFFLGIELMLITIVLALVFTLLQVYEYIESLIRISDSVYGSTFFIMTGFHGLHVIVGSVFLITCLVRIVLNRFYYKQSIGLECSIWYWHFVDVVWLFLFVSIYTWGNLSRQDIKFGGDILVEGESVDFVKSADFAVPFQLNFQDSATITMEGIVDLHHYIIVYLVFILVLVLWVMAGCVIEGSKRLIYYIPMEEECYDVDLWSEIVWYQENIKNFKV